MKSSGAPQTGDIVKYVLNGHDDPKMCGIWEWAFGLLLSKDQESGVATIMSNNGVIHTVKLAWIEKANEDSWLPGYGQPK